MVGESREIVTEAGQLIGSVNKTTSALIASMPNRFEVILEDSNDLSIKLPDTYRNMMHGLCGDFDNEKAADLRSPKGCIFLKNDGPILAASWIPNKDKCTEPEMKELILKSQEIESHKCARSIDWNSVSKFAVLY